MEIKKILEKTANVFKENNINEPFLEAEILLAHVLKKTREFFYAHAENEISVWDNLKLKCLLKRRLQGWPSAYLTGSKYFYGLNFRVNKNVLIPRPETELMVDEAMEIIKNSGLAIQNVIDVGTGSGCVVISIAKNLLPGNINFWGLDISKKALQIARKNAKQNNIDGCINFLYSDLLDNIDKKIFSAPAVITANLPYLSLAQAENSPSIQKEPKIALMAGFDGLDCYRRLFKELKKQADFSKPLYVLCEIDEAQADAIEKLVKQEFPLSELLMKNDLNNLPRLAVVKI